MSKSLATVLIAPLAGSRQKTYFLSSSRCCPLGNPYGGSVNQTVPSDFTTTSFGELKRFSSNRSTSTRTVPSFSLTTTRRRDPSHVTRRPCKSSVLPLQPSPFSL